MDNPKILTLLERQRDTLFDKLNETSISGLYKEQYDDIKDELNKTIHFFILHSAQVIFYLIYSNCLRKFLLLS